MDERDSDGSSLKPGPQPGLLWLGTKEVPASLFYARNIDFGTTFALSLDTQKTNL